MCLGSLFDERKKINDEWAKKENAKKENEWNDDEDEQRRVFHEEEQQQPPQQQQQPPQQQQQPPQQQQQQQQPPQLKCEMTGKSKIPLDCNCKRMCTVKKSETYLIHYEGGIGMITKK